VLNSITETCVVSAPREKVFKFLSDIENLPQWSTKFIKKITKAKGKYTAQTPIGKVFIKFDINKTAGIIDIYAGATEDKMTPAYMRIISLPNNSTAVMFTFFQWDSTPDAMWEIFCEWIKVEVENIRKRFCR
jgi:hypothetical protein